MPADENEDVTEVFAHFGRALYMANVLEAALAHALLQIVFMKGVREDFIRKKAKNFDPQKYEKDFDEFSRETILENPRLIE